jgi:hypothetical protein
MLKATPALQVAFACHRDQVTTSQGHRIRPEGLLRVALARGGWPHPVRRTLPRGPASMVVLIAAEDESHRARVAEELTRACALAGLFALNHHGRDADAVLHSRRAVTCASRLVEIFTAPVFSVGEIPA